MVACILDLLDEDREQMTLRGRLLGSKNIHRRMKKVEGMFAELGCYGRKAWRMTLESFQVLHDLLEPQLREEFKVGERTRGEIPNGEIPTELRLSAMRFYPKIATSLHRYPNS